MERNYLIEVVFNALNGGLKKNLKDPDSLDVIEWAPVIKTKTGYISLEYRAKNSLGGMVVEAKRFKFDLAGNLTAVEKI